MDLFSEETATQVGSFKKKSLLKIMCLSYSLFFGLQTFCHSNPGTYGIVFIPELVLPRYFCLHGIYIDFVDSKSNSFSRQLLSNLLLQM